MRRLLAVIAITAAVLTACGGNDAAPRPRIASGGPITTTAPPPLDGTNIELNQHFWHDGFRVDLDGAEVWTSRARFTNRLSYWLTLRGRFENFGADAAFFEPEMTVLFDGLSLSIRQGQPPQVGAGSSEPGELTFLVTDDFEYRRAELLVGSAGKHQARVPLGPLGDSARLAPSETSVSASGTIDLINFAITSAELRYDDPLNHTTVDEDKVLLSLNFDVTSLKEGDGQLVAKDFELLLPDGSAVAPHDAVLGTMAGSADGVTTEDRQVRFIIEADAAGDYRLRIAPGAWFLVEDGPTVVEIDFSI